jgi:hypothetical protein
MTLLEHKPLTLSVPLREEPPGVLRVYAVIGRYLANPAPFDDYLRLCGEQAETVRREIETVQGPGVSKEELMARARRKGLIP